MGPQKINVVLDGEHRLATLIRPHEKRAGEVKPVEGSALELLAARAIRNRLMVAVAESVTSGAIAARLGSAPRASDWFVGGIVTLGDRTKFDLLGIESAELVSPACAVLMADKIARLTRVTLAVAVTGVLGTEQQRGVAPGTVFVAVRSSHGSEVRELRLSGDRAANVIEIVDVAVSMLAEYARQPISARRSA